MPVVRYRNVVRRGNKIVTRSMTENFRYFPNEAHRVAFIEENHHKCEFLPLAPGWRPYPRRRQHAINRSH